MDKFNFLISSGLWEFQCQAHTNPHKMEAPEKENNFNKNGKTHKRLKNTHLSIIYPHFKFVEFLLMSLHCAFLDTTTLLSKSEQCVQYLVLVPTCAHVVKAYALNQFITNNY